MYKISHIYKSNRINKVFYILLYILAFLFGLNLFGLDNILLIIMISIISIRQFLLKKIRINNGLIFTILFSISYFSLHMINYSFEIKNIFYYLFFPIGLYLVGSSLVTYYENDKGEKNIFNFLFFIIFGFVCNVTLGLIPTVINHGFFQTRRYFIDIWSGEYKAATGIAQLVILSSTIIFPMLLIKNKYKKWYHVLISIIGAIVSGYSIYILQTRSSILIIAFCALFFPILLALCDFKKYKKILITVSIILLLCSVLFFGLYFVSEKFRSVVNSIPIINRLFSVDESTNSRTKLYRIFFDNFIKYPFGGMSLGGGIFDSNGDFVSNYFHNTWLDIYRVGGILPFVCFIVITIQILKKLAIYSILGKNNFVKIFLTYCFIGFIGLFAFEPVIEGNIYFFSLFFLIYGAIERLSNNLKTRFIHTGMYSAIDKKNYKIVFISNFLSIHQQEMHEELLKLYGDRYHFISLKPVNEEHLGYDLGYEKRKKNEVWRHFSQTDRDFSDKLIEEADIIFYGNVPDRILKKCRKKGKILFRCAERLFKKGKYQYLSIRSIISYFIHILPYEQKYQTFGLAYSAYTSYDAELINHINGKWFNWGYWTKKSEIDNFELLSKIKMQNNKFEFLFVNRLIDWKHPEVVIKLSKFLKANNIDFHFNIIGAGPLKNKLINYCIEENLDDRITFIDVVENVEVIKYMQKAHFVLSSSDQNEGWGATVNEGMTNGCVVLASHFTGSALSLIQNGENGIIYDFNNLDDLYNKVFYLCTHEMEIYDIGKSAFIDMKNKFNAEYAVQRLTQFIDSLIDGRVLSFEDGPMSSSFENDIIWDYKKLSLSKMKIDDEKKDENNTFFQKENKIGLKKGAIISYLTIIINILAGLLYTPWLIKELGQADYGIYSLVNSIIALVAMDLGLGTAVSRFIAKYRASNEKEKSNKMIGIIFRVFIILSSILFIVLVIIYCFLSNIYIKLTPEELVSLKTVFIMVGFYSTISFVFIPLNGIMMGNDKFPQYKIITFIGRIINILLVVLGLLIGKNLYIYVLMIILSGIIEIIIKTIYVRKKCEYGNYPEIRYRDKKMFQSLVMFSFWSAISALANRFIIQINPTILGITSGTTQIAIFTLGATIEGYVWQFANVLDGMFMPRIAQMNHRKAASEEYVDLMIKVGRIQLFFTGLIIVGFIALGRGFINDIWKMNSEITSYDHSFFVCILLLLPCLVTYTQQIGNSTLIIKNKVKYRAYSLIITAIIIISLSLILTTLMPEYGAICAGISVCVGKTIGMDVVLNYFYHKHLKFDIKKFFRETHLKILPTLLFVLLIGFFIDSIIPNYSIIYFAIKIFIMVVIYIYLCWKFAFNNEEKKIFQSIIDKIIKFVELTE